MSKKHLIVIIDDCLPNDPSISVVDTVTYDSIKRFVESSMEWQERSLEYFIKNLVKRASVIENVEIVGFYRIEHYLNSIEKGEIQIPTILIIDWDFGHVGASHKAIDYLPKVLARKDGLDNIYIFSRSDNMNEIAQCLVLPEMLIPEVSIFLYDKGKKEHEEGATMQKLVDRALRKVEDVEGKIFYYNKKRLTFSPSIYITHYLDFWKIAAIIGQDNLQLELENNNYIVNREFIEIIFSNSHLKFYHDVEKKYLFAGSSQKFTEQFGTLSEINAIDALKLAGIDKIERVLEKSIVKI